jgi:hypothetical protein
MSPSNEQHILANYQILARQEISNSATQSLDFPTSDMSQLIPMIFLNAIAIISLIATIVKVCKTFKKRSVLFVCLLGTLIVTLLTQFLIIPFYIPIAISVKNQITFVRTPISYVSNLFSCASVLHRFYTLIPSMNQMCCIKKTKVYKFICYFLSSFLLILWVASLALMMAQMAYTPFALIVAILYNVGFIFTELIVSTVLLYLVLGSRRPMFSQLSIGAYLKISYKPILVNISTYILVVITGTISSSSTLSTGGGYSYAFIRLVSLITEAFYYLSQVWFLILIRDTSQNMDRYSEQLNGSKFNSKNGSKNKLNQDDVAKSKLNPDKSKVTMDNGSKAN